MAKVEKRKARKDYPENGIKKGDEYYFAAVKTGPRSSRIIRSLTPPRPSQLTSSEFLAEVYDMQDDLADSEIDLDRAVEISERLREMADEQQEKFDNLPENFQNGEQGERLTERSEACSNAADEIENIVQEWKDGRTEAGLDEEPDGDEPKDKFEASEYREQLSCVSIA